MDGTKHIRILLLAGLVLANVGLVVAQTEVSQNVEGATQRSTQSVQRIVSEEEITQTKVTQPSTTVHRAATVASSEKTNLNKKPQRVGSEEKDNSTQINLKKKPTMKHHDVTMVPSPVMSTESPKRIDEK